MAREKDVQHMLEDIRLEAEMTRSYTGYKHFSEPVMQAMAEVPRHRFVPEEMQLFAYANGPLSIGYGQTISQPYIVALMTELLALKPESKVLEIGTGSGYQTAILSRLADKVYSVELVKPLADAATERLHALGYTNIETCSSDGYLGWPEHAPYDGIIVTAAAPYIPEALTEQLKPGGRLVIPVGRQFGAQELLLIEKGHTGDLHTRQILPVAFVPLTHKSGT
ncbi:MAG: protein-L-isoaspartate(D-aspartate) O-methyltransferase [Pseudomonadota bacterium]